MIDKTKQGLTRLFKGFLSSLLVLLCFQIASADEPVESVKPPSYHSPPALALAKTYHSKDDLTAYWVSEKLDGVRAYWNGKQLLSKQGNVYHAPTWFTQGFPQHPLDGELWIGQGTFEQLVSTVRKDIPVDTEWKQVKYMVFDLPASTATFTTRLTELHQLLENANSAYLELIEQSRVDNHDDLMQRLDQVIAAKGEGLMLHNGNAIYRAGRTRDVLKVKRFEDAEALVIAHLSGKGKYQKMLGALLLETEDGKRFRIGSGFSDAQRKNPPPIGSSVTYRFTGKTKNDIPKFASFLRIRSCPKSLPGCSSAAQ
ncbi:MAG: DNA ligase [Methylococcales bacterium]